MPDPSTFAEYFAALPAEQRARMEELRELVRSVVPDATEEFSYRMPVFKRNGKVVVWLAAYRDHHSVYPATDAVRSELGAELEPYLSGKGTMRFDADAPLPTDLIRRIVEVRAREGSPYSR